MTTRPNASALAHVVGRVPSGEPVNRYGAGRRPHRALRSVIATVALLGVILAACSPNQAASRPASNAGAAPKAGAATGVQVGQVVPPFSLTTLEGKPLTSADLQGQEKPYILYFFATW